MTHLRAWAAAVLALALIAMPRAAAQPRQSLDYALDARTGAIAFQFTDKGGFRGVPSHIRSPARSTSALLP